MNAFTYVSRDTEERQKKCLFYFFFGLSRMNVTQSSMRFSSNSNTVHISVTWWEYSASVFYCVEIKYKKIYIINLTFLYIEVYCKQLIGKGYYNRHVETMGDYRHSLHPEIISRYCTWELLTVHTCQNTNINISKNSTDGKLHGTFQSPLWLLFLKETSSLVYSV